MSIRRTARAAVVAATALVLLLPTATGASAHDDDRYDDDEHHAPLPTSYLLDPAGVAAEGIYPEGIAVRGDTFYVGSTTDGTIYRGDVEEDTATPFLLGGLDDRTSAIGMKVKGNRLFVAGGATGRVFAYDLRSRELVGSWQVEQTGAPTFLNDIAIGDRGEVYVTDSLRPVLYRIGAKDTKTTGVETLPTFIDFTGTALQYVDGFNVNGIVASKDGRYLVLAQSNAQKMFRVKLADSSVTEVDLGGAAVAGDGLVLKGRTLYAIERQGDTGYVVKIDLGRRLASGEVVSRTTDPSFNDPTTAALVGTSLLVVNSQFGERAAGVAPAPFTVSRVPAP